VLSGWFSPAPRLRMKTRLLEAKMGVGIPLERPRKGLLQKSTKCLIGIIRSELDCAMRPLNARWALETA